MVNLFQVSSSSKQQPKITTTSNVLHDNYDVKGKLGRGGSAKVYELISKSTGKSYACKVVSKKRYSKEKIYREIKMLSEMAHPNVVPFSEYYENKRDVFIIMSHAAGGELFQVLKGNGKFPEWVAEDVIRPLIQAVAHLHEKLVMHRDIKLENILLKTPVVKQSSPSAISIKSEDVLLVDFGLAKQMTNVTQRTYSLCGSQYYVAPEVWLGRGYGLEVDMWGIGVVLYMLLTNTPPFYETDGVRLKDAIVSGNFSMEHELFQQISPQAKDILRKLLTRNPARRITAKEALQHDWLLDVVPSEL